ncbi:hypothetical protein [Scytonema sp. NUACC26]|uniref:hypothetical protein n=1 Tax=Scytonema sp. NUACC26 TaxID=3140176 RepID=UPI0034DC22F8
MVKISTRAKEVVPALIIALKDEDSDVRSGSAEAFVKNSTNLSKARKTQKL